MKCNIGKNDKVVRFGAAIVIGVLGIYYHSWWGLLALVPLITAAVGFCPIYSLLTFSSSSPEEDVKNRNAACCSETK